MDAIGPSATLNWVNVALGLSFVLFNVAIATYFGLGIGRSLLTAAIRCVLQLAVVALLLQKVFESNNPFAVAGIACKSSPPTR
jgi:ABC-type iron transport system FetAB permease component